MQLKKLLPEGLQGYFSLMAERRDLAKTGYALTSEDEYLFVNYYGPCNLVKVYAHRNRDGQLDLYICQKHYTNASKADPSVIQDNRPNPAVPVIGRTQPDLLNVTREQVEIVIERLSEQQKAQRFNLDALLEGMEQNRPVKKPSSNPLLSIIEHLKCP